MGITTTGHVLRLCKAIQRLDSTQLFSSVYLSNVVQGDILGKGQGGSVYKGVWDNTTVAMKLLHDSQTQEFMDEALLLRTHSHPNVVQFLGVYKSPKGELFIVTEFMDGGSLLDFVINNGHELTNQDFLAIAKKIASGMTYLSRNSIVHRDLSCRNCLVNASKVVKVSDFGLSRTTETYYKTESRKMPYKWSAPECILYGKFSTASDVWSYGIVLWELFSLGVQPYPDMNNKEVITEVCEKNYRMPIPKKCPEAMYQLMLDCWNTDAHKRPNFAEIFERLSSMENATEMKPSSFSKEEDPYYSY